eukprot:1029701-Amphidinium_carterae.1
MFKANNVCNMYSFITPVPALWHFDSLGFGVGAKRAKSALGKTKTVEAYTSVVAPEATSHTSTGKTLLQVDVPRMAVAVNTH